MDKPILVFKIGTSSITLENGLLNEPLLDDIARQIAELHLKYHVVIVSSGAVGTGKKFIANYSGKIEERKAAAAIGNPILINKYTNAFNPYHIPIAQSLCERQHFSNRNQFLQLKDTYKELWKHGIIPIANENDVVSNYELKFSDNDELAALIAVGFGASILLIGTSVPGVLDHKANVVKSIGQFDEKILGLANKAKSDAGLGGMLSKLTFARLATSMGIKVVIFNAGEKDGLLNAEKGDTGTVCMPKEISPRARQQWLAGGCMVSGRLKLDKGAQNALMNRKSLLAVGIEKVVSPFNKGEVVEFVGTSKMPFAVGRAKISSEELNTRSKEKNLEVANADDIVLL